MPTPIATWNPARGVWETDQQAICGHSGPFLETWPTAGSMRSGRCSRRPEWAPRTGDGGCSSLPLLPTPDAGVFNDGQTVEAYQARKLRELAKGYNGNGGGTPLAMLVRLLPTPRATDGERGQADANRGIRPGSVGTGSTLAEAVNLLPTPTARDHKGKAARNPRLRADGTPRADVVRNFALPNIADRLLPTPRATDGTNGGPNQRGSSGDLMLPSAVAKLLPTPTATDAKSSSGWNPEWTHGVTLTDAARSIGTSTGPPSPDGNDSSDEPHPTQLF